jgi:hypothetical protein
MPRLDTATGIRSMRVMLTACRVPADDSSITGCAGVMTKTSANEPSLSVASIAVVRDAAASMRCW